jgi:serine/threonine protein kinase
VPDAEQSKGARRLKRVGGYELLSQLGSGGMGTVFKARHSKSGRIVALKVLPPSIAEHPEFVSRFQREAKLACGLKHPNLVAGIEAGSVSNLHFYAMEYVHGESVEEILERHGRMSGQRLMSIRSEQRPTTC